MAIASMNDIVVGLVAGQTIPFYKSSVSTKGAGYFHTFWPAAGNPVAGATPATGNGEAVSSATTGAMQLTNAGSGKSLYIARVSFSSATAAHYILHDRLVQKSGLVGNTTSPQTFETAALTRYTDGVGCQLWLEFYTATGATSATCTISYTNQAGTAGRTSTPTWVTSQNGGTLVNCPLQAGDTGIRSVQSLTLGTSLTAGNFGVVITRQLIDIPIPTANGAVMLDAISCGLPKVENNACLSWAVLASMTTTGPIFGQLTLIEG